MASTLIDATVGTYQQILGATKSFMAIGRAHCDTIGRDVEELVQARLADDMLGLWFQIVSVAHHSVGALQAVEAGVFGPPKSKRYDYAGLEQLVENTITELKNISPDQINLNADKPVTFEMSSITIPFAADDFLLTFSLPNFYFHATTAYDILRAEGVQLGKRDFLGHMRIKM